MSDELVVRMTPLEWYEGPGTPDDGTWWWAVEHQGHPAFYLRALMPGDHAPLRRPAPRHVLTLDGDELGPDTVVTCGTCDVVPDGPDLEPIERRSGQRGFLQDFRAGRHTWPAATRDDTCWFCSNPRARADRRVALGVGAVMMCAPCAAHSERGR